jgi:hypothetical protein
MQKNITFTIKLRTQREMNLGCLGCFREIFGTMWASESPHRVKIGYHRRGKPMAEVDKTMMDITLPESMANSFYKTIDVLSNKYMIETYVYSGFLI